jgi:hypothetical protein
LSQPDQGLVPITDERKKEIMKTCLTAIGVTIYIALSAWSTAADIATTTSTITAGTIEEFDPATSVVVHSRTSTTPLRYSVSRETRFVDELGAPVTVERITRGTPITVYYIREGDQTLASRVIVHQGPMTKARAKALKAYYDKLESESEGAEKVRAKALEEYYDKLEDELDD